jgi:hypothetical protein
VKKFCIDIILFRETLVNNIRSLINGYLFITNRYFKLDTIFNIIILYISISEV